MKKTLVLAAAFAALVLAAYAAVNIMRASAVKPAETVQKTPERKFVPPLEWINEKREKAAAGAYHTKGVPPKTKVFQTLYKGGTQIVFSHEEHVETYGLSCIECHHVESCSKCHLRDGTQKMEVAEGKQALHENCMGCHAEMGGPQGCLDCHKQ